MSPFRAVFTNENVAQYNMRARVKQGDSFSAVEKMFLRRLICAGERCRAVFFAVLSYARTFHQKNPVKLLQQKFLEILLDFSLYLSLS